jgi:hypothetical protein
VSAPRPTAEENRMSEKFPITSAKTAKDLDKACSEAAKEAKKYGFTTTTALKNEVVEKAMTTAKKPADFIVEVDVNGAAMLVQMYCEVKGSMKSVLGRKEIKSVDDWKNAIALAKNANLKKVAKANNWGI